MSAARSDSSTDQGTRSSYFTEFAKPGAEYSFLANDKALLRNILSGVPAAKRDIYISKLGEPDALRAALAWYHVFAQSPAPSSSTPAITPPPVVSPVRVPTLYVWGDRDQAFGRAAAEKTSEFVSGPYRFEVLEGVGHWVPEVAPDVVNRLLLEHLRHTDTTGAAGPSP